MNIFQKKYFLCKNRKTGVLSLVGNYLRPSNNSRQLVIDINAVVLMLRFTKMVKCLPEFEYFYCVLEK